MRCTLLRLVFVSVGLTAAFASAAQAAVMAEVPPPGDYVSYLRIMVVLICVLPWLMFCQWVDKDTLIVRRMQRDVWNPIVLGGGVIGLAAWLLPPWTTTGLFAAGFGLWLVITVGTCSVYVAIRNSAVDAGARVFTPRHIKSVMARKGGGKKSDKFDAVERVRLSDHKGGKVPPPSDPNQTDVYEAAQTLLFDALWRRATDVELLAGNGSVRLAYKIDGVPSPRNDLLTPEQAENALVFIKQIAGLEVAERRKPQEGSISGLISGTDGRATEMEVRTSGTTQHERLALRIVGEQNRLRIADLGLTDKQQAKFEEAITKQAGLVVVSGPRATGVTTTLYAALRNHDAFMQNLLTLEHSTLMDLENITQNIFDPGKHEASFARQLQSILRREPDVVMVSDCPDRETAHLVAEAANDGKKVYIGLTARDSFEALKKILSLAGDTDGVASALSTITSQRLVRKLCIACRQAYKPDEQLLKKANLPVDKIEHFFRPPPDGLTDSKGNPIVCTNCQGSGYYGRTAVFEILEIDNSIREMIKQGQPVNAIRLQARKNGMLYLQEVGLQKVIAGITSMNEVLRVMRDDDAPKPAAAAGK